MKRRGLHAFFPWFLFAMMLRFFERGNEGERREEEIGSRERGMSVLVFSYRVREREQELLQERLLTEESPFV